MQKKFYHFFFVQMSVLRLGKKNFSYSQYLTDFEMVVTNVILDDFPESVIVF